MGYYKVWSKGTGTAPVEADAVGGKPDAILAFTGDRLTGESRGSVGKTNRGIPIPSKSPYSPICCAR